MARTVLEVKGKEQLYNTVAHAQARKHKKFFPLGCLVDEITGRYKFDQPCGLWNKPCVHGCGYIHFSAATSCTLARCCAGGLLSSNSTNNDMDLLVNYELDEMPDYLLQCIKSSNTFGQDFDGVDES